MYQCLYQFVVFITCQEAIALHQKGQLALAQAIYREVLQLQPRHFDALHWSGVVAAQTKDHASAVALIGQHMVTHGEQFRDEDVAFETAGAGDKDFHGLVQIKSVSAFAKASGVPIS